jgi:hypothetical protein
MSKKIGLISSFSAALKKATTVSDDLVEIKKAHRQKLSDLVDDYVAKVADGKAEGIRNAKDLVEVMKLDLLMAGDVTDRTETSTNVDEARVTKITKAIDLEDPAMANIMEQFFLDLNHANDEEEDTPDITEEDE